MVLSIRAIGPCYVITYGVSRKVDIDPASDQLEKSHSTFDSVGTALLYEKLKSS